MSNNETLHFEISINAPVEKVWKTMLEHPTYEEWTKEFEPTSTYEGSWEKGSKMKFISSESGEGMSSEIEENIPGKFISVRHVGVIKKDGTEDTESDEVKKWAPSYEKYTFEEKDGGTLLKIDMDSAPQYKEMFLTLWPKALQVLKATSEK